MLDKNRKNRKREREEIRRIFGLFYSREIEIIKLGRKNIKISPHFIWLTIERDEKID